MHSFSDKPCQRKQQGNKTHKYFTDNSVCRHQLRSSYVTAIRFCHRHCSTCLDAESDKLLPSCSICDFYKYVLLDNGKLDIEKIFPSILSSRQHKKYAYKAASWKTSKWSQNTNLSFFSDTSITLKKPFSIDLTT